VIHSSARFHAVSVCDEEVVPTLSIVIPALDEARGIRALVERVLALLPGLQELSVDTLEVIVVDDGSTDETAAVVATIEGVRLISHDRNCGYGAALKTGFAAATGEWIGFLDADGTYPPERFPDLLRAGLGAGADIVVGSRRSGARSRMPVVRRIGNQVWSAMLTAIGHRHVADPASGMRVFRAAVLRTLSPLPDGLNLTPVMTARALHEDLELLELPIPYDARVGESKLDPLRDGAEFTRSIVWTSLGYNPSRILAIAGGAMMLAATAIGLSIVGLRLRGVTPLGPVGAWTTFMAVLLALGGLSVATLGIGFNYFVALLHREPVRQGLLLSRPMSGAARLHLGWLGGISLALGIGVGLAALGMGLRGWPVERLWFYYLFATAACLGGVQSIVAWVQFRVLEALSRRDDLIETEWRTAATRSRTAGEASSREVPASNQPGGG
jgi:glycosyltransferase involved in cell wall biosynthesis